MGGSLIETNSFFAKLIHNLRSTVWIPGDEDVIIALHPKLRAGAYLISISALMFLISGVQFIRFIGRLRLMQDNNVNNNMDVENESGQNNNTVSNEHDLKHQETPLLMSLCLNAA